MCILTLFKKKTPIKVLFADLETDNIQLSYADLKKAKNKDSDILFKIGEVYFKRELYQKALSWLSMATSKKSGHGPSEHILGLMYAEGRGVKVNAERAFEHFLNSAKLDHVGGALGLARLYENGIGTNKDYKQALKWYQMAVILGSNDACYNIGYMLHYGLGISPNYASAMLSYLMAASEGHVDAMLGVGDLYCQGKGIRTDYKKALDWYKNASEHGSVTAMLNVGALYWNGQGVEQDIQKAIDWNLKASNLGNNDAHYNLGVMYERKKEFKLALDMYQKCAESGDEVAAKKVELLKKEVAGLLIYSMNYSSKRRTCLVKETEKKGTDVQKTIQGEKQEKNDENSETVEKDQVNLETVKTEKAEQDAKQDTDEEDKKDLKEDIKVNKEKKEVIAEKDVKEEKEGNDVGESKDITTVPEQAATTQGTTDQDTAALTPSGQPVEIEMSSIKKTQRKKRTRNVKRKSRA